MLPPSVPAVSPLLRGLGGDGGHEGWTSRASLCVLGPEPCRPEKASLLSSLLIHKASPLTEILVNRGLSFPAYRICFLSSRTQAHIPRAGLRMRLDQARFPHCVSCLCCLFLDPLISVNLHLQVNTAASDARGVPGSQ